MDWGPIPCLVQSLTGALWPARGRVTAAAEPFGGPWGVPARAEWRDRLAILPPHPGRFAWWFRRPSRGDLTLHLMECHAWLEERNRQYLRQRLAPFASDPPARLWRVSNRGLAWAVFAFETGLAEDAPGRAPPNPPRRAGRTGDLLALHLLVEDLARTADVRRAAVEVGRCPGGLRDPDVFSRWHRLPPRRRKLVAALAAHSPLTRFVYADSFSSEGMPALPVGACGPLWRTPADPTPGRDMAESEAADAWGSQLARSLLAAALSPPASAEALHEAREQAAVVQPRARAAAASRVAVLEMRVREERRGRCELFAELLRGSPEDVAARAVHLRFLDMLIRHTVTASGEALRAARRASSVAGLEPSAFASICGEHGGAYRAFLATLFGEVLSNEALTALAAPTWDALRFLLDSGPLAENRAVAGQLGVREAVVARLRTRFETAPVRPPFPTADDDELPAPATVLGQWWVHLLRHFRPEPTPPTTAE